MAARLCAAVVGAGASVVIGAWYARLPAVLRFADDYAVIQYNAAACLIFASVALAAVCSRRQRIAFAAASLTLIVSGLTLAEHLTGWSAGIDQALWHLGVSRTAMLALSAANGATAGRMAANTSAGLAVAAIALLVNVSGRMTYLRLMIASVFALATSTVGAVALAGYLFGLPSAYGWGTGARMAPQTAMMFIVLGLGTLCASVLTARRSGLPTSRVTPGLAGATVAVAGLLMWEALLDHDRHNLDIAVRHQANAVASALTHSMDDRVRIATRLVREHQDRAGASGAAGALADLPGVSTIALLDTAGQVTWRMPDAGYLSAPDASLLRAARGSADAVASAPIVHGVNKPSVYIAAALHGAAGPGGYLLVDVVPDRLLGDRLPVEFRQLYRYSLRDSATIIAGSTSPLEPEAGRWSSTVRMDVAGRRWQLTVAPTAQTLGEFSSALPTTFLVAALMCALFAGRIVRAAQVAKEHSEEVARGAADLAAENEARRDAELLRDENAEMLEVQSAELGLQYAELQETATTLATQRDELGRAQEFSAALVRSTVDAVAAFDREGRVHAWNPAMAALTGRPVEEVGDATVGTLLPFLGFGEEVRLIQQALAGVATTMTALASHHVRGADVALDLAVTPMRSADGAVVGGLLVARDVTEQRRVAEVILASKEAAEASNRAKSDFLARMSHELRTPLNAVIGFTNVLRRNRDNRLVASDITYLDRISANGKHLLALIDTVLDLTKIESGREIAEMRPVGIPALVRETAADLELRATEAGLRMRVDVPAKADALTDDAKLRQVLVNLIGNAIKFTARGGEVCVRVLADPHSGAATRIDVEDTGIGIAPDRLQAVFEAFEQADAQIAHVYGGTGLGLSICRKLCALMGHDLVVASEPGKGSTFSVLLRSAPAN